MSFFIFYIIAAPLFSFFDEVNHCIMLPDSLFSAALLNFHLITATYFLVCRSNPTIPAHDGLLLILVWMCLDFYLFLSCTFIFILLFFEGSTLAKVFLLNCLLAFRGLIILQLSFVKFSLIEAFYIFAITFYKHCLFIVTIFLIFCCLQTMKLKAITSILLKVWHSCGEDEVYHKQQ